MPVSANRKGANQTKIQPTNHYNSTTQQNSTRRRSQIAIRFVFDPNARNQTRRRAEDSKSPFPKRDLRHDHPIHPSSVVFTLQTISESFPVVPKVFRARTSVVVFYSLVSSQWLGFSRIAPLCGFIMTARR